METRNIIILGASAGGLHTTHSILRHLLPVLKAQHSNAKYHIYSIAPSHYFYFRVAAPRVAASTTRLAASNITFDVHASFAQYSSDDVTFVEAAATSLDTTARTVSFRRAKESDEEKLQYHALVVATGSRTHHQAFSSSSAIQDTLDSITATNDAVQAAQSIVISGGGPTAVEFAGEVAEHRNGAVGWFSTPSRKVKITLLTADKQLLPSASAATGKRAEKKLTQLGVDVVYNTHATHTSATKDGKTAITLSNGETLEADLYVPAYGVLPNSEWLPKALLDNRGYLLTNDDTTRVDAAGPRVYAIGDIASYTKNNIWDILGGLPVLAVNMKRDLLSYNALLPDAAPKGKDRLLKKPGMSGLVVPVGSGGGVGEIMGWSVPSWLVWLLKARTYMVDMSGKTMADGSSVKKEVKWTREEAAI